MMAILQEIHQPSITEISLKIIFYDFIQISQGPMSEPLNTGKRMGA